MALPKDLQPDIEAIGRLASVPTLLEVVCRTTGMGFAAVARVTEERWVACSVLDKIDFGLKSGGELSVETTICHEIRQSGKAVVIDHVSEDPQWSDHACPAMYGFQSYISVPIILRDGSFFGTLCAIDPRPARINTPEVIGTFHLFAELIAKHLDADRQLFVTETALADALALAELREQFMAVLGHDLRTPLRGIRCFTELMMKEPLAENVAGFARVIRDSSTRMQGMIENLLDLARCRLGNGLALHRDAEPLEPVLRGVIAEQAVAQPEQEIEVFLALDQPVNCDRQRIAQLFSNLLGNALNHGAVDRPIQVSAVSGANHFELSVANSGKPISTSAMQTLFQPFHRSTGQNQGGLGLGLYIAHEIASAHGGTLEVQSTQEHTRFTFFMPLV